MRTFIVALAAILTFGSVAVTGDAPAEALSGSRHGVTGTYGYAYATSNGSGYTAIQAGVSCQAPWGSTTVRYGPKRYQAYQSSRAYCPGGWVPVNAWANFY